MRLIVDTSIVVAWVARCQATPLSDAAADVVATESAVVPVHFQIELANALWQLERRGRLDGSAIDLFVSDLRDFSIEVDRNAMDQALTTIFPLARKYKLTAYDAAYLELALRQELPLATRDRDLAAAAATAGAVLFQAA